MTASATDKKKADAATETANADMLVINPEVAPIDVAGVPCNVRRIQTRELMLAVRVVTAGGSYGLQKVNFKDRGQIAALLLMAIPEAHEEFLQLLRALLVPVDPIAADDERYVAFTTALENPPIEITMDVVNALVHQEAGTFEALWGKARNLLTMAGLLGKKTS